MDPRYCNTLQGFTISRPRLQATYFENTHQETLCWIFFTKTGQGSSKKFAHHTVFPYGLIDTIFDPPLFSLDSTFNVDIGQSKYYRLDNYFQEIPAWPALKSRWPSFTIEKLAPGVPNPADTLKSNTTCFFTNINPMPGILVIKARLLSQKSTQVIHFSHTYSAAGKYVD
jgi:hypothetical protein